MQRLENEGQNITERIIKISMIFFKSSFLFLWELKNLTHHWWVLRLFRFASWRRRNSLLRWLNKPYLCIHTCIFLHLLMSTLMRTQVARLSKPLETSLERTHIRLLSCMSSHVSFEVEIQGKSPITDLTLEWLLPRMH